MAYWVITCMVILSQMIIMGRTYGEALRWRVLYHLSKGSTISGTVRALFVSKKYVRNIRDIYEEKGHVHGLPNRGRMRHLNGMQHTV